jgi:hypothetical protein
MNNVSFIIELMYFFIIYHATSILFSVYTYIHTLFTLDIQLFFDMITNYAILHYYQCTYYTTTPKKKILLSYIQHPVHNIIQKFLLNKLQFSSKVTMRAFLLLLLMLDRKPHFFKSIIYHKKNLATFSRK